MVIQYVMKSKNKYGHSITAVAVDALGNEIISVTMSSDTISAQKKKQPKLTKISTFIKNVSYIFLFRSEQHTLELQ